jgi:hypothetical protein
VFRLNVRQFFQHRAGDRSAEGTRQEISGWLLVVDQHPDGDESGQGVADHLQPSNAVPTARDSCEFERQGGSFFP